MSRYNQPAKGATNWDEPLNENFANLEIEVTDQVATFDDLPEPTGETSSNGLRRQYLVRESRTVFRDTDGSWEAVAGLGAESNPVPGTSHFEHVRTDEFYTVEGTTVGDIANAVANHDYIKLQPGVTYTHDGSVAVTHGRGDGHTVVDAHGATIQVRGTIVETKVSHWLNDSFQWYGGIFQGSNSDGEVAFDVSDSIFGVWRPKSIRDCEAGMLFYNERRWCEFNEVSFRGNRNRVTLAMMGNDGQAPSGRSFREPAQGDGTHSFRNFDIDIVSSPLGESGAGTYGVYTSDAKPYHCEWNVDVNLDDDVVGLRMHKNFEGTWIYFHSETPSSRQNGTAIVVDALERPPIEFYTRIVQAGGTIPVENNTSSPLVHKEIALGGSAFGPRLMIDGSSAKRWSTSVSSGNTEEWETEVYHRYLETGSASDPVIKIGSEGAGLFVNDSGELVAVDESGNTNTLT